MPYIEISTNTPCHYLALDIKGDDAFQWANGNFNVYKDDFSSPLLNPQNMAAPENWILEGVSDLYAGATFVGTAIGLGVTSLSGIWKFDLDVEGNSGPALDTPVVGIAITCEIDCCIAEKMSTYLSKSCDHCSKKCCDKDLEEIYKIYMLIQTAKIQASELNFDAAYVAYMQAKTLCSASTGSCDCNCS